MAIYRGVNGVNRKIKEEWRGVNGVNRKIKEEWRGVNGVNRKVFSSAPPRGVLFPFAESDEKQLLQQPLHLAWRLGNFYLDQEPSYKLNNPTRESFINSMGFSFQGYKQLKIDYSLRMTKPRDVGCEVVLKDRIVGNALDDGYVSFYTGMTTVSIPLMPNLANTVIDSDGLSLNFNTLHLKNISFFAIYKIWLE